MFRKIVVGYDGSEHARDAIALARALAEATGAGLLVACVYPQSPLHRLGSAVDPAHEQALREWAESVLGAAELGAGVETRVVPGGSPANALNDLAEAERADLIVLGSTHRGAAGRVLPGSVAERLLHGAPCGVAVAPRGFAERAATDIRVIGIAYDGWPESDAALQAASSLAETLGASLRVLTVIEPLSMGSPALATGHAYADIIGLTRETMQGKLNDALGKLPAATRAEGKLLDGPAAPTIIGAVEEGIDLLVLGSRGYGPLRRVLLGGVSAEVMRTAPCPVLVVPRGSEERAHKHADNVATEGAAR